MSRKNPRSRSAISDDSGSGSDSLETRTRAKPRISYRESDVDEETETEAKAAGVDLPDESGPNHAAKNESDGDFEDVAALNGNGIESDDFQNDLDEAPRRSTKRRRKTRELNPLSRFEEDDDDFYEDDAESEEDEFLEKIKHDNFVVSDEEHDDDQVIGRRSKRRRTPGSNRQSRRANRRLGRFTRSNRSRASENDDESLEGNGGAADIVSDGNEDLRREVADLEDDSPEPTPLKHKLRERNGKVNYTIPLNFVNDPVAANASNLFSQSIPGRRGRKPAVSKNEYRHILFPTAGPFGGSDVISILGQNVPPGGISIPGVNNHDNKLNAIGQNASDSDSSEDEIAPINGESLRPKKADHNFGSKLIGGPESRDKKKNNLSDTDPLGVDMNIDFSVVGGLDNYINQLKEMVALPLLYPELYQNFGITPPRGVLFHGPPGTGKTLMARALAASCSTAETKITFFMRKGADCLSKWVGEAERQLRLLFEEAKNQQPSIIFFDEIDGLAPVRSSKQEQIHASIVSTLLALMDGMDNRGQVIVIGATNRPDSIDPALRRPGRFDREFYFPLPDLTSRKEIVKIHTRKWEPPLQETFIDNIATLTKGYGGADIKALCTEAALHGIQRTYPQIYQSKDKLQVNPQNIKVVARDFMWALEKIIPSSARSTSSTSAPVPDHLSPLLEDKVAEVTEKLHKLLPRHSKGGQKKLTALDEALYVDLSVNDADGGFARQQLMKSLENVCVCKPRLLISGEGGNGQQYIGASVLHHLEGFQVQTLDMASVLGDSSRTPEMMVVQAFIEARRHQPSVIFIPNIDLWYDVVPFAAKSTLASMLRNLKSTEQILIFGIAECPESDLDPEIASLFGTSSDANNVKLTAPGSRQKQKYFASLKATFMMKPHEFINDLENRPKRDLEKLPVAKATTKALLDESALQRKKKKEQEYNDAKLKNVLKIKLAALMDLFKVRYKRFKKPIIDESYLFHLFDPTIIHNAMNHYEVMYQKSLDPEHENMILELSTGRYYFNMDLDIIEERLWNGFYSEPKQFLKDIKMIVKDAITSGDRERILKSNEMLTNAQFGIDEIATPELSGAWKGVRAREIEKQAQIVAEHEALVKLLASETEPLGPVETADSVQNSSDAVGNTTAVKEIADVTSEPITSPTIGVDPNAGEASYDPAASPAAFTSQPPLPAVQVKKSPQTSSSIQFLLSSDEPEPAVADTDSPAASTEVTATAPVIGNSADMSAQTTATGPLGLSTVAKELTVGASNVNGELRSSVNSSQELIFNEDDARAFFDHELSNSTTSFGIETLESVMARLMSVILEDRQVLDKNETLKKLRAVIAQIRSASGLA